MVLTLDSIISEAEVALRHELDPRLGRADFANRVGRRWVAMNVWNYLDGGKFTFTTVSGQVAYALPRDLSEIRAIYDEGEEYPVVRMLPWSDWLLWSERDLGASQGSYFAAVNFQVEAGEQVPTLHLAPTPSEGRSITVGYRRGWAPLQEEGDVAQVPTWAEEAFLELTRALAHGYSRPSADGNPDPVPMLVRQFKMGDAFQDARTQDGMVQPRIVMGAGALQSMLHKRGMVTKTDTTWGPVSTNQDLLSDLT